MKLKELIGVLPETGGEVLDLHICDLDEVITYNFLKLLSEETLDAIVKSINVYDGRIAIFAEIEDSPKKEAQEAESFGEGNIVCDNCMYTGLSEKEYPCCKCQKAYTLKYVPRGDV